jgi:hypothetical protein
VARRRLAALLVVVATLLAVVGLPLDHAHRTTRPDRVGAHAEALLRRPVVRDALVSDATDGVTYAVADASGAPASAVRPLVAPLVPRVVDSPAFRPAWRAAARRAFRDLRDGDRRRIAFRITDLAAVTTAATGPLPAQIAAGLQAAGDVDLASFRRSATDARRTERADELTALGRPALAAAIVLVLLALVVSSRRRSTLVAVGIGAVLAGVAVVLVELVGRSALLSGVADASDRRVTAAVWDELLGGLRTEAVVLAAVGVAVAGIAAALRPQAPPVRGPRSPAAPAGPRRPVPPAGPRRPRRAGR